MSWLISVAILLVPIVLTAQAVIRRVHRGLAVAVLLVLTAYNVFALTHIWRLTPRPAVSVLDRQVRYLDAYRDGVAAAQGTVVAYVIIYLVTAACLTALAVRPHVPDSPKP